MFVIASTVAMGGLAGYSFLKKSNLIMSNDAEKISRIFINSRLYVNENKQQKNIRLHRKRQIDGGMEYVFQLPLGLSFKKIQDHKHVIEDGLNVKNSVFLNFEDIKKINWKKNPIPQIKKLINNKEKAHKEIDLDFDGMLKIRVYEDPLTDSVEWGEEFLGKSWSVPIGRSRNGLVFHNFEELQIFVVAGMTRYGKTVFLKNVITTLISNEPENVKFTLIDLKGGLAFNRFKNASQVNSVAPDMEKTLKALESIHTEILERQKDFEENGFEDIGEAGIKERHFVIVDEGAEIAGFQDKETRERCTYLIGEIARIGAGLGYRMVFATQYPTADVFPRQVKANTSGALCFKLKTAIQSAVVLDHPGAEELPVGLRGRAIYQTDKEILVQTPYISNKEINKRIEPHITIRPRSEENESLSPNEKTTNGGYTVEPR